MSSAEAYRWSGSFASARMTTASSSCGTSGRIVDGGSGTREVLHRDLDRRVAGERDCPVSISYSTIPSE